MGWIRRVTTRVIQSTSRRDALPQGPRSVDDQWDAYAQEWEGQVFPVREGHEVAYLGDEWTAEDPSSEVVPYGLPRDAIRNFGEYLTQELLDPYLPPAAEEGLEIGPGGGRITELLLPRTSTLHVADVSKEMLRHLRRRLGDAPGLEYHLTDGRSLPALKPESLDYVLSFDVFVHLDARLTYWYLRQIPPLLRPGGVAIIHYPNVLTIDGWRQFERDLEPNLQYRVHAGAFSVMCPQLMKQFLATLDVDVIAVDLDTIPRDAVAVFRRPIT